MALNRAIACWKLNRAQSKQYCNKLGLKYGARNVVKNI